MEAAVRGMWNTFGRLPVPGDLQVTTYSSKLRDVQKDTFRTVHKPAPAFQSVFGRTCV